jgi:hypothetical protein
MFCKKCGEKLPDNSVFCPKCGMRVADMGIQNTQASMAEENEKTVSKTSDGFSGKETTSNVTNPFVHRAENGRTAYVPPKRRTAVESGTAGTDPAGAKPVINSTVKPDGVNAASVKAGGYIPPRGNVGSRASSETNESTTSSGRDKTNAPGVTSTPIDTGDKSFDSGHNKGLFSDKKKMILIISAIAALAVVMLLVFVVKKPAGGGTGRETDAAAAGSTAEAENTETTSTAEESAKVEKTEESAKSVSDQLETAASAQPEPEYIEWKDSALGDEMAACLGKEADQITAEDLSGITAIYFIGDKATEDSSVIQDMAQKSSQGNITDLQDLQYFTSLSTLYVWGNSLNNLDAFSDSDKLGFLYDQLVQVNFDNNSLIDISPMVNLTGLETVSMRSNKIDNINVLGNLTKLKILDLTDNQITDAGGLSTCKHLKTVKLAENPLTNWDAVKDLPSIDLSTCSFPGD